MPDNAPKQYKDALLSFEAGVNQGVSPLLLPKNQLHKGRNMTVRGTFAKPRPVWRKLALSFTGDDFPDAFEDGYFQAASYYKPDSGSEYLLASIAGRLFAVTPGAGATADVTECTTPALRQSLTAPQCWIWQAEKWAIFNDGVSNPLFWDGTTIARSTYGTVTPLTDALSGTFIVPAIGAAVEVPVVTGAVGAAGFMPGDVVRIYYVGTFMVQNTTLAPASINMLNVNSTLEGQEIAVAAPDGLTPRPLNWRRIGTPQLPPGRMGAYGMGRNWMSLVDGRQFVASDLVGGSSGTEANEYRDAVLNISENLYLAGGGNFMVPGSIGDIKAMRFTATLDASLGQGPLQVFTPNGVFSCQAPVDRMTWQDLTNPILTQSLITNGGLGQDSTVLANGDILFRSKDGIRSLILARRDFSTWGNVPASREVDDSLARDAQGLLAYGSAVVFDNRLLMTYAPVNDAHGVYHRGLIALNFDPVSSLRGKAPSVYDGIWTGTNILKIVKGEFSDIERCFAFCLNTETDNLEVWELLTSDSTEIRDDGTLDIIWEIQSPALFRQDPRDRKLLRLAGGEIMVSDMQGTVQIQVWYRPDWYPCWTLWHAWEDCALESVPEDADTENYQPGFRPRAGLGEPDPTRCDPFTNRPLREGHHFQVRVKISGHCTFQGGNFTAVEVPQEQFAPPICSPVCDT